MPYKLDEIHQVDPRVPQAIQEKALKDFLLYKGMKIRVFSLNLGPDGWCSFDGNYNPEVTVEAVNLIELNGEYVDVDWTVGISDEEFNRIKIYFEEHGYSEHFIEVHSLAHANGSSNPYVRGFTYALDENDCLSGYYSGWKTLA